MRDKNRILAIILVFFICANFNLSFDKRKPIIKFVNKVDAAGILYYYDKYTSENLYSEPLLSDPVSSVSTVFQPASNAWSSYSFDSRNGTFAGTGTLGTMADYSYGYILNGNQIRWIYRLPGKNKEESGFSSLTGYQKGSLVQSNIQAVDGTYPNNGRHSDGYWYIKGAVVNNSPLSSVTKPSQNETFLKDKSTEGEIE